MTISKTPRSLAFHLHRVLAIEERNLEADQLWEIDQRTVRIGLALTCTYGELAQEIVQETRPRALVQVAGVLGNYNG